MWFQILARSERHTYIHSMYVILDSVSIILSDNVELYILSSSLIASTSRERDDSDENFASEGKKRE